MNAILEVEGKRIQLQSGAVYLIGKKSENVQESDNKIALENENLDEKHAVIEVLNDALYLYDLFSKAGTFLNDKRLKPCIKTLVKGVVNVRFAGVVGKFQSSSADENKSCDSSGFHDDPKNTSDEIICPSPELVKPTQSRLRRPNYMQSLVSTSTSSNQPAVVETNGKSNNDTNSFAETTDKSKRNSDSFTIPETQCPAINLHPSDSNASADNSFKPEKDFCIPETQEIVALCANENFAMEVVNANLPDNLFNDDNSNGEFRICTQDFNLNSFNNSEEHQIQCSELIPPIATSAPQQQEKTNERSAKLREIAKEDLEVFSLNWSTTTASKNNTINSNAEPNERSSACTPDLFDLPEAASLNVIAAAVANDNHSFAKQIDKIVSKSVQGDDEDLMPTQVFIAKEAEQQPTPVPLTLSNKENALPEINEFESTQIFPYNDVSVKTVTGNGSKRSIIPPITAKNLLNDPYDDASLPATQVFPINQKSNEPLQKTITNKRPTTAAIESCFNSTLVCHGENKNVRNVASFFEEIETSLQHATKTKTKSTFKKPKLVKAKKTTSISSTEDIDLPSVSEAEFLMCTPQLLKDTFEGCGTEVSRESVIALKQKVLFDAESDDEQDILKLRTKQEISHDFEKLLPHLNNEAKMPSKSMNAEGCRSVHNMFNKDSEKATSSGARNNRHLARDKQRVVATIENRKRKPESKFEPEKLKTTLHVEKEITEKRNKIEQPKAVNTTKEDKKKTSKESSSSSKSIEVKKSNNTHKTNKKATHEPKTAEQSAVLSNVGPSPIAKHLRSRSKSREPERVEPKKRFKKLESDSSTSAPRRITRLQSRGEISSEEQAQKLIANEKKDAQPRKRKSQEMQAEPPKKRGRSGRSQTHSQEVERGSIVSDSSKITEDAKQNKQLHRMNSKEETTSSSSTSSTVQKLKVAMTMVEPELFKKLAANSSGLWTLTQNPLESDILIMDKGNRTYKFLIAIALGIPIVTTKWLECVNKTKTIAKRAEHFFVDKNFERRHKFSLLKSLELARKTKLFENYEFLLTPNILPQPAEMQALITSAGGKVCTDTPKPRENQKIYLISAELDKKLWHKYRRINNDIRIINTEGIMVAVMRQTVEPLNTYLIA